MNLHEQLTAAADQAAKAVEGTAPSQYSDPTPCGDWDVKALLNHLVLWTAYSFERRARSEHVGEDLTERDFAAEPDVASAYRAQLHRALDAWSDPSIWETQIDTGHGTTPGTRIAEMILMELVLHGWDLARATGQPFDCPDEVAATVQKAVTEAAEMYRQYEGFAPEVPLEQTASPFDRALAISGRDPR